MLFYLEHKTPAVHIKVKYDTIGVMPKTWPIQVGGGTKRLTPHLSCYSWLSGLMAIPVIVTEKKNSFVQVKPKTNNTAVSYNPSRTAKQTLYKQLSTNTAL